MQTHPLSGRIIKNKNKNMQFFTLKGIYTPNCGPNIGIYFHSQGHFLKQCLRFDLEAGRRYFPTGYALFLEFIPLAM